LISSSFGTCAGVAHAASSAHDTSHILAYMILMCGLFKVCEADAAAPLSPCALVMPTSFAPPSIRACERASSMNFSLESISGAWLDNGYAAIDLCRIYARPVNLTRHELPHSSWCAIEGDLQKANISRGHGQFERVAIRVRESRRAGGTPIAEMGWQAETSACAGVRAGCLRDSPRHEFRSSNRDLRRDKRRRQCCPGQLHSW
jgi:hypothetical protein